MPSIEIRDKQITAQGESVIKILVDGKPFFGTDPFASLKNLPADVIDKVQVYNEKTDQEQFTGFREGPTAKTINIVTKPNKRNGMFGKVYAGGGGDPDGGAGSNDVKYGTGATLNKFGGDQRLTLTGQSNNVNAQSFTDNSGVSQPGLLKTNAAGINYSNQWNKKADLSGSYFFSNTSNEMQHDLRKTYTVPADSGQIYTESSPSRSRNYNHRANVRLNYKIDSMNSLLLTPNLTWSQNDNLASLQGNTVDTTPVNKTSTHTSGSGGSFNFSNNLLFRHKFSKKGRTLSANLNTSFSNTTGSNLRIDTTTYYRSASPGDTLNQLSTQHVTQVNLAGNVTYTEPVGDKGLLKLEYVVNYLPSASDRNVYDYVTDLGTYSRPDSLYSNSITSRNLSQTAGSSYMLHFKNAECSFGLHYQVTHLLSSETVPVKFHIDQPFQNLLPVASLHFKLSKSRNLQCNYNTSTQSPTINQLQNVINNFDPLHLNTGNPRLRQPYRHNVTIRYNSMSKDAKRNFSSMISGAYGQHNIAFNSIIATKDSLLQQNILLHTGSQLTVPVNLDGNESLNGNLTYGVPLGFMKSRLNMSMHAGITRLPAEINGATNYQQTKTGGLGLSISSNVSENVDFTVSSNTDMTANTNSINPATNTSYLAENAKAACNLVSPNGWVFNTMLTYQSNTGLSTGFNQDFLIWNVSVGKKFFKKRQGDLRISAFDVLNQNKDIQHTVTDVYVQDTRSNILQRYILLVFTYKINSFKSAKE